MKQYNKSTGHAGEQAALEFLQSKHYTLLEKNFSNKFGEIDLIMQDGTITVFVEVKTKTGLWAGSPEEMITNQKLHKIRRMASIYTQGNEIPCRIDVVAVVLDSNSKIQRITHYENVY